MAKGQPPSRNTGETLRAPAQITNISPPPNFVNAKRRSIASTCIGSCARRGPIVVPMAVEGST